MDRSVRGSLLPLKLTTNSEATKLLIGAKTIAVVRLTSAADVNEFVKTVREQLPGAVILVR